MLKWLKTKHPVAKLPSIAVVGAGAVGCYFGGMFARAGHAVTFIGRADHVAAMRANGLFLDGLKVHEFIPVNASTEISAAQGADIILFCVKTLDTASAAQSLAPYLAPGALVVSLQNGVENAAHIQAAAGFSALSTVVYVGAQMLGPGHVKHTGRGDLVVGWPSGATVPATNATIEAFSQHAEAASIPCRISTDIAADLWLKLIMNSAYNAVSALGQTSYGVMLNFPPTRALMQQVIEEGAEVAAAAGIHLERGPLHAMIFALGESAPGIISSTLQDLRRGKRTEIDDLNGYIVRRGQALGVPTPVNAALLALVKLRELALQQPGSTPGSGSSPAAT